MRVNDAQVNAQLAALDAGDYEPATPADTLHRLEVEFTNAPAGMRSGLRRIGAGPSDVTVRTQTAMATP